MPLGQRTEYHRDAKLRALARGKPCMVNPDTLVHRTWNHDPATVVWGHSNLAEHGKGKSIRAHDCFGFLACHGCHALIDQGTRLQREERRLLQRTAMFRTRLYLSRYGLIIGATADDAHHDGEWLAGWLPGRIRIAPGAR
jgi:ferredoxin